MTNNYHRLEGYVLKRTNYAEADRILHIITPNGKMSVIAKGVRREKSKLAGAIEPFSLTDFTIHTGKSELGILTGAKMITFHRGLISSYDKMEMAGSFLKKISSISEGVNEAGFFDILKQAFFALDKSSNIKLIEAWFLLNIKKTSGEEINLYRDLSGEKLLVGEKYDWDEMEKTFVRRPDGLYSANEIKLLRLIITNKLDVVMRVKTDNELIERVLRVAQTSSRA